MKYSHFRLHALFMLSETQNGAKETVLMHNTVTQCSCSGFITLSIKICDCDVTFMIRYYSL